MKAIETLIMLRKEYRHDEDDVVLIDEAIAELEALQAPKTCEGCVWVNTKTYLTQAYCVKCIRNDYMEDRYEPKDNQ